MKSIWKSIKILFNRGIDRRGSMEDYEIIPVGRAKDIRGKIFGRLIVIARINKSSKGGNANWLCLCECGNECTSININLYNGTMKSCGCLKRDNVIALNRTMVGDKHPRWKEDLTDDQRKANISRQSDYRVGRWRKQVFMRDYYTCQCCGTKEPQFNAHHLNGWDNHPSERFDVSNGVTLCETCHVSFHEEYGFGDNTREEYENFLETKMI